MMFSITIPLGKISFHISVKRTHTDRKEFYYPGEQYRFERRQLVTRADAANVHRYYLPR